MNPHTQEDDVPVMKKTTGNTACETGMKPHLLLKNISTKLHRVLVD
jgi:hypothetical protein